MGTGSAGGAEGVQGVVRAVEDGVGDGDDGFGPAESGYVYDFLVEPYVDAGLGGPDGSYVGEGDEARLVGI